MTTTTDLTEMLHATTLRGVPIEVTVEQAGQALTVRIPSQNAVLRTHTLALVYCPTAADRARGIPADVTHLLWTSNEATRQLAPIAVSTDTAATIEQAIARCVARHALTPEGLRARRRVLLDNLKIARDVDAERREYDWSRENERGWATEDRDGKIAAAVAALDTFDLEHPEVATAWDARADAKRSAELDTQINYRGE